MLETKSTIIRDPIIYHDHKQLLRPYHNSKINKNHIYYTPPQIPPNDSYKKEICAYFREMYIEHIKAQKISIQNWGNTYKNIMDELFSLMRQDRLINNSAKVFKDYNLSKIATMIEKDFNMITNQMDFFYTLSNLLSKYPEISTISHRVKYYLSIVDDNKISLTFLKKNNCVFRNEDYTTKLNLVFTPENKVNFSSSDSNEDNYFVHGTFDSPKSFFSNRKIKKLLRILDE